MTCAYGMVLYMQDAAGSSWPMNISGWTNDSSPCDNPIWSGVVCEPQLITTNNVSFWMEVVTALDLSDMGLQVGCLDIWPS